ncbi:extracellular solute-binding protein [Eubacteriales bacterium OttesenSCG-928-G02]|nr:extracellular solute-binding protein [Eubacteriales bacterium OttesenSCG-928-G02]
MKKFINLLLIILILTTTLVSCKDKSPVNSSEGSSAAPSESNTQSGEESDEPSIYGENLPVKDMEGRVFKVLAKDFAAGSNSIFGYNGEIIQRDDYDELTAGIVDVAKHETRVKIEDRYNCKIEGLITNADGTVAGFNNLIKSSAGGYGDLYDVVFDAWGFNSSLIEEGMFVDMNKISTLDFSNPWWDQNSVSDMSILNKQFWITGDINTYDNEGTWVMLYNKDLFSVHYPNVDLYQLVYDNEWTFDKLEELSRTISKDSDSNGVMDENDTWGFATECYNVYVHLIGADRRITIKNSEDIPEFNHQNESFITALLKFIDFYKEENITIVADTPKYQNKGFTNVWEETTIKAFKEGRALFFCCGLINVAGFRDLDFKYGFLPMPKYSSDQEYFQHSVSRTNMSAMSIPRNYADYSQYEDLGLILEALGAESKNSVTPIFYEKSLKGRDADETNDEKMLDLIFSTRCFDMATAFGWGGILSDIVALDPNVTSLFQSHQDAVKTALEKTINSIKALDD